MQKKQIFLFYVVYIEIAALSVFWQKNGLGILEVQIY